MELDPIDAVAEAIVGAQLRTVAVGVERQAVQRVAGESCIRGDIAGETTRAVGLYRLAQGDVGGPQVARRKVRRLVVDAVRLEWRQSRHGPAPEDSGPILH